MFALHSTYAYDTMYIGKEEKNEYAIMLKGSAYILVSSILAQIFTMVTGIFVARWLGPENLGLVGIAATYTAAFALIASLAIPNALMKYIAQYKVEDKNAMEDVFNTSFTYLFISSAICCIIYFVSSFWISENFYKDSTLGSIMQLSAIGLLFIPLSTWNSTLQAFQRNDVISKRKIIFAIVGLPITLALVYFFSVYGMVLSGIVISFANNLAFYKTVRKISVENGIHWRLKLDKSALLKLWKFSWPITISSLLFMLVSWFPTNYLGITQGFMEVGLWRVVYGIYVIMMFIPNAISMPFIPLVSEMHARSKVRLKTVAPNLLRITGLVAVPLVTVAATSIKFILPLLYGNRYADSSFSAFVMCETAFIATLAYLSGQFLAGTGRTVSLMWIDTFVAASIVGLSYLLIPKYGFNGLACAWFASYAMITIFAFIMGFKLWGIEKKPLVSPYILWIGALPIAFVLFVKLDGIVLLAASILMGLSIIILEWFLITSRERAFALKTVARVIQTHRWKNQE
jgi:O-antigen/teichoic acid export membrane protein